jgi:hypothetical protein
VTFKKRQLDPVFTNSHGEFRDGDAVWFDVENQVSGGWLLPTRGTLCFAHGEWVVIVKGRNDGIVMLTINKGYDIYGGSIRRPVKSMDEQIMDALENQAKRACEGK